jgi:hypothetical protein
MVALAMFGRGRKQKEKAGSSSPLVEYLYVDGARLDAYFEQLSGPVTFEKVPTFGGSLGMTGPSVSASQAAHGREFTRHEKLIALVDHLNENGYLGAGRPGDEERWQTEQVFRSETCRATRVLIPDDQTPLALWICDPPANPDPREPPTGFLYLIEDFRPADQVGTSHIAISGYSALTMLLQELDGPSLKRALIGVPSEEGAATLFSRRPLELVEKLGGKVGEPRTIKALYRLRATLADEDSEPMYSMVAIGYPIAIEEAAPA